MEAKQYFKLSETTAKYMEECIMRSCEIESKLCYREKSGELYHHLKSREESAKGHEKGACDICVDIGL